MPERETSSGSIDNDAKQLAKRLKYTPCHGREIHLCLTHLKLNLIKYCYSDQRQFLCKSEGRRCCHSPSQNHKKIAVFFDLANNQLFVFRCQFATDSNFVVQSKHTKTLFLEDLKLNKLAYHHKYFRGFKTKGKTAQIHQRSRDFFTSWQMTSIHH